MKKCVFWLLVLSVTVFCGAHAGTANGASLNLSIWPESGQIGTPGYVAFQVEGLGNLDLSTFSITFDGMEVGHLILDLAGNHFVFSGGTQATIWLGPILLPAGSHEVVFRLGKHDQAVRQARANWEVQAAKGNFLYGIHMPPFEDWEPPYDDWSRFIKTFNNTSRIHTVVMYFASWKEADGTYREFNDFLNDQIISLGAVPLVTWEPWQAGGGASQEDFTLAAIYGGQHDAFIEAFAADCAAFGYPIIIRMMHEFNGGSYYPWNAPNNGNDPTAFITAFRRVVDIFKSQGAHNARFMWSPNWASAAGVPDMDSFYPGDDYVDYIGVSGHNWGSDPEMQAQGWMAFNDIYDNPLYGSFLSKMAQNHPSKQVLVAEIGCNEDATHSKASWITNAYDQMRNRANVVGGVWFNNKGLHDLAQKWADFRVIANPNDADYPPEASLQAYVDAVQ